MSDEKKSSERMTVHVNGVPVELFRGMKVRHALIALDYEYLRQAEQGLIRIEDENGFAVGLDGALQEGSKLILKSSG
ncbi:MAG: hypothetical protein ABFD62_03125 [Syntrophaceae bacterium]